MKKSGLIIFVAIVVGLLMLFFSLKLLLNNASDETETDGINSDDAVSEEGTLIASGDSIPQKSNPEKETDVQTEEAAEGKADAETAASDAESESEQTEPVETESAAETETGAQDTDAEEDTVIAPETDKNDETKTPVTEKTPEETTEKVTEPAKADKDTAETTKEGYVDKIEIVTELPSKEHSEILPNLEPAQITLLKPVASGEKTKSNESAIIDYSNIKDGYIMVKYTEETNKSLRVQVIGPETTYTYIIKCGKWEVFPLSDGNGGYKVKVFKNVSDKKYSLELSCDFSVKLEDEFAPFIRPNQYVNYEKAENTMNKAAMLVAGKTELLDKVAAIYQYVVTTLSYDYDKAATVKSGYLPDLDKVLEQKKGICFDYAALMTGMLRSQNIPCKLVVGYANEAYHAWISVWSAKTGWIDGVIFFDGVSWQRMDPTFASSSGKKSFDNVQYTAKYFY